jgi:hypothetical protein
VSLFLPIQPDVLVVNEKSRHCNGNGSDDSEQRKRIYASDEKVPQRRKNSANATR